MHLGLRYLPDVSILFICGLISDGWSSNLPSLIKNTVFIGYGDGYIEYQPAYQLQERNINTPKVNRLLGLMEETFGGSKQVVYVDVEKRIFTDSQGKRLRHVDILLLFNSKIIFGIDDEFTSQLYDVLTSGFHVSNLKNFFSMSSYLIDSSKFITCQAMMALKEKYKNNKRMTYYLNLFFPETGVVESLDDIYQLIVGYKNKGIVFKLDKGVCGEGVVVLTKDILAEIDENSLVGIAFEKVLGKAGSLHDLQTLIGHNKVIWQEYIDSPVNEIGLPLVLSNQGSYRIGGYGYYLTNADKSRLASIFSVVDQHWLFANISKESEEIFEKILTELIEKRRFIQTEKGEKATKTLAVGL
ncbi:MAG: hypothetical protein OXE99_11615, partial [Cellvibrionales bacterium]|nr:hypothetical protein [Cellvibrionales bacterium]